MQNIVENLLIIYSADDGGLKILLQKKEEEPYKGYWTLPGKLLDVDSTQVECSLNFFEEVTSIKTDNFFQGGVFSELDRHPEGRVIALTSIIITDKDVVDLKKREDTEWFSIDELPKLAYDHRKILDYTTKDVKNKIIDNYSNILLNLFPSDFTLSEFQKFYEYILEKKVDRRNFRKKLISQDLVIDTGEKTSSKTGRPGALYRFNEENMRGQKL